MRICLCSHSFPPFIGGGETHLYLLAQRLHQWGHEVTVVTGLSTEHTTLADAYPFRVIRVKHFRDFENGVICFRGFLDGLHDALESVACDVTHVHNFMPALAYAIVAGRKSTKVVFTFHSTPIPQEGKILGHFRNFEVERAFTSFILGLPFYHVLVCPSRYYYSWALRLGASRYKTRLVYHGIDVERFQVPPNPSWREAHGFAPSDIIFVCVARMTERKGILDLLRAIQYIREKRIKFYISSSVVSGSTEYAERVQAYIQEHGLEDRVRLTLESDTFDAIPRILASCNGFILPSHFEGLGIVLLEGMAAGLPIVASNTTGINEVIRHGVNGLLSRPKDPQDLAEKISIIASTPTLAAGFVREGKRIVTKRFSLNRQVERLVKIYA